MTDEYPEHEKLCRVVEGSQGRVVELSQAIGDFLEWAEHTPGLKLCYHDGDRYWPTYVPTDRLLAQFFGIDLKKLEREKQAMLERLREASA